METRSYSQLYAIVQQFYNPFNNHFNISQLRGYLQKNAKGYSMLVENPQTPFPSFGIVFNQNTVSEHEITIRIPGYYTFGRKLEYYQIHKFDFSVAYSTPKSPTPVELTHIDIATDLYGKAQNNVHLYGDLANVLRNIYYGIFPLNDTSFNHYSIFNQNFQGISIPALVSNIKWISLQEDINHPAPSWGKKLAYCRYFEAIYAAANNIPFSNVSSRISNCGNARPDLWADKVYHIQIR